MLLARRAVTGNFDYRTVDRKPEILCAREQARSITLQFGDSLATLTDQELRRRTAFGMGTGYERIAAFDTVDQTRAQKEFQRPVYDGRRNLVTVPIHSGEDFVSTERLMTAEQNLQDLASARCQALLARGAELPGHRHELPLATVVIVVPKRETR